MELEFPLWLSANNQKAIPYYLVSENSSNLRFFGVEILFSTIQISLPNQACMNEGEKFHSVYK